MTSSQQKPSWLRAIKDAANEQNIPLPPFTDAGMGSALCRDTSGKRFISFKRRLVSATDAVNAGVEWTLWLEEDDHPTPLQLFASRLPQMRTASSLHCQFLEVGLSINGRSKRPNRLPRFMRTPGWS